VLRLIQVTHVPKNTDSCGREADHSEKQNATYFRNVRLVVHVDGRFDRLLRQATETAGRHAGYVAQCHRLTIESDAGNTPSGQEIEGTAVVCIRSVLHIRFEEAKKRAGFFYH
jgi:hypothetical protein